MYYKNCRFSLFIFILLFLFAALNAKTSINWQLVIPVKYQNEEAVKLAAADLQEYGRKLGIIFKITDDQAPLSAPAVIIGGPSVNRLSTDLQKRTLFTLKGIDDEQGYEIVTVNGTKGKIMVIAGGDVIGSVYGMYWLWDRMRVYKTIPDINTLRTPRMKIRMSLAWGRSPFGGGSKESMHRALRQSTNWVSGPPVLDLVPWNSEPENNINKKNREKTRELIDYAHSLHMKYFSFANEFTYHPSILREFNASLSPCDSAFWDALQEKYRMLFNALPELDGIEVCNDDISGFWDNYRGFDLMHQGKGCEWPYTKRFQTFVNKLSEVVIDEFDKTYFHFTWNLRMHEQHYSAEVFRDIFADGKVRADDKLFLIPKITAGDRWWHQPYNSTFNISPQKTLVAFETMNYYEGGASNIFPTFSGQYFQEGLKTILMPENSNVHGAGFLVGSSKNEWDTRGAYSYVLYRLSWNPYEDITRIAEDFAAINFGRDAAKSMAEIYMM